MIKIEGIDWEVLEILNKKELKNCELIELTGASKSKISKTISGLEVGGLVKRDGKIIQLTKQGKWYAEFYKKVKKNRTG